MIDKTLFNELKQRPVWTINIAGTKKPYDLVVGQIMQDRSHTMTLARTVKIAKQRGCYDPHNLACLEDVRQTHLLMLDLEASASAVWRNLVLSLPLAYVEESVHGGLHALMIVTDEQLKQYPHVFDKTVIQLGENVDLEVFPNGKHFCSFTGKQVPTMAVKPEVAYTLRENLLKRLSEKAIKQGASNVQVTFEKLKPYERQFGNQMFKYCTIDKFQKQIQTALRFTGKQMHLREFIFINGVMNKIAFMSKKSRFKTNLTPQSLIQITDKIARNLMLQLGWYRDKWNDRYREGDYITYETVRVYVKERMQNEYIDCGELN